MCMDGPPELMFAGWEQGPGPGGRGSGAGGIRGWAIVQFRLISPKEEAAGSPPRVEEGSAGPRGVLSRSIPPPLTLLEEARALPSRGSEKGWECWAGRFPPRLRCLEKECASSSACWQNVRLTFRRTEAVSFCHHSTFV